VSAPNADFGSRWYDNVVIDTEILESSASCALAARTRDRMLACAQSKDICLECFEGGWKRLRLCTKRFS
jgi:hypothetical protein